MSDDLPSAQGHSHGSDDGGIHAHVSKARVYWAIFFALIGFTILTVYVASIHLGPANLAVAVIIASIKAALVCAFFMHLAHDTRFHVMIIVSTVMFIGVFFAYTTNDTSHREELNVDTQSGARTYIPSGEKAPGSWERPQGQEKIEEKKPAASASASASGSAKAPEHK